MDTPGRLVGSGRYADVYDIGRGRVLRRYREASALAGREAEVMAHARAHGVPLFARSYLAAAGVTPAWLASAARHRLKDPSVHAAEAVRIRRLLRSARLADRPRR